MTHPTGWPTAQSICDIPEVRAALDAFAQDANEENMLAMVSAIMGHAPASMRAAALEEAALICDTHGRANWNDDRKMQAKLLAKQIRALSAAPAGGLGEVESSEKELAIFTEYFVKNYPGPDTIIHKPEWHAPRIFAAAKHAIAAAQGEGK